MNQSIQFLAEEEYRPAVGVFPFGANNEFAKSLGIPCNIFSAVSTVESGCTKTVDIGQFGNQYFTNIAAAGWLTDAARKHLFVLNPTSERQPIVFIF